LINFGIIGGAGRMGQAIARASLEYTDLELTRVYDLNIDSLKVIYPVQGTRVEFHSGIDSDNSEGINGLIDFSIPEATRKSLAVASERQIPIVIGTTGFDQEMMDEIKEVSTRIPVLLSFNMSIGVNILFYLAEIAARALKGRGFDAEMMEIHHKHKTDAPSGTAKTLETILLKEMGLDSNVTYGREGFTGERKDNTLGSMALRGGDVVGDHTVFFLGNGERIELKHQATSREIFARGAIDALVFLTKNKPGLYTMRDLLGLHS